MVLVSLVSLIETEEHKKDYSDESDDKKTIGHQGLGRVIFEVFRLSRRVVRIISIGGKGLSEQREETIGTTRRSHGDRYLGMTAAMTQTPVPTAMPGYDNPISLWNY